MALLLLLGAITSVLVAWACEACFRFTEESGRYRWVVESDPYLATSYHALGRWWYDVDYSTFVLDELGGGLTRTPPDARPGEIASHMPGWVRLPTPVSEDVGRHTVHTVGAGYPCVCVVWMQMDDAIRTTAGWKKSSVERWTVHLQMPWNPKGHDNFSLLPVPVGLAIDTGFWGVVWWGGVTLVGLGRRRWRARRGRCPRCGYDRRSTPDAPCPECGSPAR